MNIYANGEKEGFANTGAIALGHCIKLNPKLFELLLESLSIVEICKILASEGQRVQQSFITMLNIALLNNCKPLVEAMTDQHNLVLSTLNELLEHSQLVIRGKSILTVVLLIKNSPVFWFCKFVTDQKFMQSMDRLTKDSYKYVQYGLMHFIDITNETIPQLLF